MENKSILFNKNFLLFFLFLTAAVWVSAQTRSQTTAMEIETLINTEAVTYAQAARFVLDAANVMSANNPEDAFRYAVEQDWLPKNVASGDPARLNNISRLLMRSFGASGGIMYSLTRNSHYAYRELVYLNVIQRRADPAMLVSGEWLLFYVSRMLTRQETQEFVSARTKAREAAARRAALAAQIATIIEEQAIADTTVEATREGVRITLSNVMFLADSAVLPNSEMVKIREIARVLRSVPNVKLLVAGHTTRAGTAEYLQELSRARAQSVADYLVLLDACDVANVTVVGYGGTRPVANNSTPEGMAANRRVEIIILEN